MSNYGHISEYLTLWISYGNVTVLKQTLVNLKHIEVGMVMWVLASNYNILCYTLQESLYRVVPNSLRVNVLEYEESVKIDLYSFSKVTMSVHISIIIYY